MQNKIFIIVVTFNGIKWLSRCLKSTKSYSVIVIDNNSTDGTISFIEENFPEVILHSQEKNLGFGQANNIGISHALEQGADYVFLLNQDAYLKSGCIEELLNIHQNNQNFGILSPVHLDGAGKYLEKGFSKYMDLEDERNTISDLKDQLGQEEVYKVPFVNAAGWLISRACLLKVGGFDPIFFHYGEDVNYVQRVKYHGFKVGVVPTAFMCHDREGSAIREGERFSERYFINIERRCKMKWADINLPDEIVKQQIKNQRKKLKKEKKQAIFKFNLSLNRKIGNELDLLQKNEKEIFLSRERNITRL